MFFIIWEILFGCNKYLFLKLIISLPGLFVKNSLTGNYGLVFKTQRKKAQSAQSPWLLSQYIFSVSLNYSYLVFIWKVFVEFGKI